MAPTLNTLRNNRDISTVGRPRVLEVRAAGAPAVFVRLLAQDSTTVAVADPDVVIFGEEIAVKAVLGGHVCPIAACREGQIELWGTPEDIAYVARHLSRRDVRRAA